MRPFDEASTFDLSSRQHHYEFIEKMPWQAHKCQLARFGYSRPAIAMIAGAVTSTPHRRSSFGTPFRPKMPGEARQC
jgi:hypothetical protein